MNKNNFPNIRSDALGIKAFPFAVLSKPEQAWTPPFNLSVDTWKERFERLVNTNRELGQDEEPLEVAPILLGGAKPNAIPMSVINATSKKRTSNKRHIRAKIASRLKIAINLIVTRGANVAEVNGKPKLVMNDQEAVEMSDKWISRGWTYIFFPTLEIYRMPYHDMIPFLRKSLREIYDQSQNLERTWVSSSLAPSSRKAAPTKYPSYKSVQPQTRATQPSSSNRPNWNKASPQRSPRQVLHRQFSTSRVSAVYDSTEGVPRTKTRQLHSRLTQKKLDKALPIRKSNRQARVSPNAELPKASEDRSGLTGTDERDAPPHANMYPGNKQKPFNANSPFDNEADLAQPTGKPIVSLGGVIFKGTPPPIPSYRRMARDHAPKGAAPLIRENDPRVQMLKDERNEAAQWLGRSITLAPMKHIKEHIKRRIGRKNAKSWEPLGPEFIGFNSRPNPSYDPFTDVEPQPEAEAPAPHKALLDLLNKRSSGRSPSTARLRFLASEEHIPYGSSKSLDDVLRGETAVPDGFDPFAPLLPAEEHPQSTAPDMLAESAEQDYLSSATNPPHTPDPDPFASAKPEPTPLDVRRTEAHRAEQIIQSFDPFHADMSDDASARIAPLSSDLDLEHLPTTSTAHAGPGRTLPLDALRKASAARTSRAESAVRVKRLASKLYGAKPVMLSWRPSG
ncbi:hypothetical protein DXG01_001116 [Tephrocybe rancida]|nr:hypothetical protein DXG01_001116 [Tephrocybe rancida]